jgi:hypothetical protein
MAVIASRINGHHRITKVTTTLGDPAENGVGCEEFLRGNHSLSQLGLSIRRQCYLYRTVLNRSHALEGCLTASSRIAVSRRHNCLTRKRGPRTTRRQST